MSEVLTPLPGDVVLHAAAGAGAVLLRRRDAQGLRLRAHRPATASGTYSSVFIAGPVLTHWKEREPVYARRRERIVRELGEVPAYATAVAGAPADVAPAERPKRTRRLTHPDDPERRVSQDEFDDMVRDLHADAPPAKTATVERASKPRPEPEAGDD
jgi:SecD/SecF fusion protein